MYVSDLQRRDRSKAAPLGWEVLDHYVSTRVPSRLQFDILYLACILKVLVLIFISFFCFGYLGRCTIPHAELGTTYPAIPGIRRRRLIGKGKEKEEEEAAETKTFDYLRNPNVTPTLQP
jgi:hypothetical protein